MRTKTTLLTLCVLIVNTITLKAQTTWTVDNTPGSGAQFSDIQSAIDAASAGDTILVQQSSDIYTATANNNTFLVDKELHFVGQSSSEEFNVTNIGNIQFDQNSNNSSIKGFRISALDISTNSNSILENFTIQDNHIAVLAIGTIGSGTNYSVNNVTVEGNVISTFFNVGSNVSQSSIRNCVIRGVANGGFSFDIGNPLGIIISNCIIIPQGSSNAYIRNNSSSPLNISDSIILSGSTLLVNGNFSFNNCAFANDPNVAAINSRNNAQIQNNFNSIEGLFGLFSNCAFIYGTQTTQADVTPCVPPSNSPLIGAGVNGGDIGFESGFEFEYLGNPKGNPEVKITNYQGATSSNSSIEFTIEARSN